MTNIGDKIVLTKNHAVCYFYGHKPGTYTVKVGDWGWDDGDLFIETNIGKLKIKDIV